MCGFCEVHFFVVVFFVICLRVCFVMCGRVYVLVLQFLCVCMCVGFVICGCVYVFFNINFFIVAARSITLRNTSC